VTEACPELAPLLAARPLGVLEEADVARLDAHTKECRRCATFAQELDSALATAKPDARPAPPAAWEKIAQRIEQDRAERLATDDLAEDVTLAVKVSLNCSFCHEGLSSHEAVYCASCLAPHHGECFEEHGRCSALGCGETRTVVPRTTSPEKQRPRKRRGAIVRLLWIGLGTAVASAAVVAAARLYEANAHNAALAELLASQKREQARLGAENQELKTQIALLRARAALAASQNRYEESISLLSHAIELDPRLAEVWSERGAIRAGKGDREGALADFERAIALDPGLATPWCLRGRAKLAVGRFDDAIADLSRAIELDPRRPESWGSRGEGKASLGDLTGARADYEAALRLTQDGAARARLLELERAITISNGPPVKVLFIERWPRRELQFVTKALRNDPDVLFQAWLMSADNGFEQEHSSNQDRDQDTLDRSFDLFAPLQAVPRSLAELSRYDVVVLADVNMSELAPGFAESLAAFAAERAGGLVFLAGEKDYLRSLRGTPLEGLLPIKPIGSVPANDTFTEPLRIGLTDAGVASPITRLKKDEAMNRRLWESGLPGPFWVAPVASVREDATVLVRTAIDDRPIFVTGKNGDAHVFVSLTDETWRWRAGAGDEYMLTFWKNVLGWARRPEGPRTAPGYLGIQLVDNDGYLRVVQVFPDSPAASRVKPDDVIRFLDGVAYTQLEPFRDALEKHGAGAAIRLVVERHATVQLDLEITLGEQPKAR
jgi:tetratricopeptide (TPR) repeat protein